MERRLEDNSPSDVETDADVLDGHPEPSKRCIAPFCPNYGNEMNNFLCNSCLSFVKKEIQKRYSDQDQRHGSCVTPTCPNNTPTPGMCMDCRNIFANRKSVPFTTQMSTEKCETQGCHNFGHVHKKRLCNNCYLNRQFSCSTKNCQNYSLAKNDFICNNCLRSRGSVKCIFANCQEPSLPAFHGKCRLCYLKSLAPTAHVPSESGDATAATSTAPFFSLPPPVTSGNPTSTSRPPSSLNPLIQVIAGSTPVTSTAPVSGFNPSAEVFGDRTTEWKICATEGCSNVETKDGFCSECLLVGYSNKQSHKANPCTMQGCPNHGVPHLNDLCPSCFSSDLHVPGAQPTAGAGTSKECVTPDCTFFGSEEHRGLCSKCFKVYTEITEIREPPRPNSPSNRKCQRSGCEFYSFPNTEGLCSICYKDYLYKKDSTETQRTKRRHASGPSAVHQSVIESLRRDVLDIGTSSLVRQLSFEPMSNSNVTTEHMQGSAEVIKRRHDSLSPDSTNGQTTSTHAAQLGSLPSGHNPTIEGSNENESYKKTSSLKTSSEASGSPTPTSTTQKKFCVLPDQCKNAQCEKKCVQETYPYCLSCFENLNLQPKPTTIQASMPLSSNNSESLSLPLGSQWKMRSASNPELNSLSDECERPGCLNPTSPFTYPLCLRCAGSPGAEGEMRQDTGDDQTRPSGAGKPEQLGNLQGGATAGSKDGNCNNGPPAKTKVSLKVKTVDPASIMCDVILCLWSKDEANKGSHPLLTRLQIPWNKRDTPQLLLGEVVQTVGGVSKARYLLHCNYEKFDHRSVANSLTKLVLKAEARGAEYLVLPVKFLESLNKDPRMVTDVCLYVIDNFQKSGNKSKKNLNKFCMCFESAEQMRQAKEEFVRVGANKAQQNQGAKGNQQACHKCQRYPQAKLKPVSLRCEEGTCSRFCLGCLKGGRKNKLTCPDHGDCLAPVGHKNTFALLVAGYDKREKIAELFVEDAKQMRDVLADQNYIGISPENMQLVTASKPGVQEDMKTKLCTAFSELRKKMRCKNHVMFFFFYSGHHDTKSFKLGGKDYTMTPKELRKELRNLDAENILITLDCCYSAGANLTDKIDDEDFMMSLGSCSKDDSEPVVYLPKLWNLYENDDDLEIDGPKGNDSKVYQWSSSVAEEKSYFKQGNSFFTLCVVKQLEGRCPCREEECEECARFVQETRSADGVFLKNLSTSVHRHVTRLAEKYSKNQHPQLEGHEDDMLVAFHAFP